MYRDTAVTWMHFLIHLAGNTTGAHLDFIKKLKRMGQTQVDTLEESDYVLLFCPIESRVGTDITEALAAAPGGKPIILVVMYHTFSADFVIPDSRRHADKQTVPLVVSCLFHKGRLLTCRQNDIASFEVQKFFGVAPSQISRWRAIGNWFSNNRKVAGAIICFLVVVVVVVLSITLTRKGDV